MRLLNTRDLSFRDFVTAQRPRYAILSHRWEDEETTLPAFQAERGLPQDQCQPGNRKVREFCDLVNRDGLVEWCWVDTCCIDKASSAELTEAVNSMYAWYRDAAYCIVYLSDVEATEDDLRQLHELQNLADWRDELDDDIGPRPANYVFEPMKQKVSTWPRLAADGQNEDLQMYEMASSTPEAQSEDASLNNMPAGGSFSPVRPSRTSLRENQTGQDGRSVKSASLQQTLTSLQSKVQKSAWFLRGWTLQELLAPVQAIFYDVNWQSIGSRSELADVISEVTGISKYCFGDQKAILSTSVARRMSWAADRRTTRIEDLAYSLLGIFDVSMPLIYGEGMRAFFRLQLEILKVSADETIFAWRARRAVSGMLAEHPMDFRDTRVLGIVPNDVILRPPYTMTNRGLSFAPNRDFSAGERAHYWITLDCVFRSGFNVSICLTKFVGKWVRIHCNHLSPITRAQRPLAMDFSAVSGSRKIWHRRKTRKRAPPPNFDTIYIAQFDVPDQELYKRCGTGCANSNFDDDDEWPEHLKTKPLEEPVNTCIMLNNPIL